MVNNDYLEHHGILGMKWGVRRYQNRDGSLTSLGRVRRGLKSAGSDMARGAKRIKRKVRRHIKKAQIRKAAKKELELKKQQQKAEEQEQKIKAAISKALATGDAETLYQYRDRLTTKDLTDASNRLRAMKDISGYRPKNKSGGQKALELIENITKVNNTVGDFRKSVNNALGKDNNKKKKKKGNGDNDGDDNGKETKGSKKKKNTYDPLNFDNYDFSPSRNTSSRSSVSNRIGNILDAMSDDMNNYTSSYGLSSHGRSNTRSMVKSINDMFESSYNSYGSSYYNAKRKRNRQKSIRDRLTELGY